ncbi:ribosomal protein S18 acetylase RimI-like enzyme [Novosphingobium kunmingense]|uniref:Ribosomal protein S18 acetylase RimI-like enzyme n=1 Tax=Novosphingobium kunmingense TaxID=1211806 RepID=A0A2N0H7K4_9SPHN|nr:GNAT family N-acetyltransferase [Novosphingobium kunmingense]PKB14870.1 ribosomal protein S18 acetylase RimI-like enzyme [Novosphingobium kunmingense]
MGIHSPLAWTIRPATAADAEALAMIAQATFLEAYAGLVEGADMLAHARTQNSADAMRATLDAGGRIWIAEAEGTRAPIGFAMLVASTLPDAQPGDIELKRIYVLDRCQGTGLAAALLKSVVDAGAGHARLTLGVNRDNEKAQGFYRKHGFAIAGTRTFTVGTTTFDDYIYARPLPESLT